MMALEGVPAVLDNCSAAAVAVKMRKDREKHIFFASNMEEETTPLCWQSIPSSSYSSSPSFMWGDATITAAASSIHPTFMLLQQQQQQMTHPTSLRDSERFQEASPVSSLFPSTMRDPGNKATATAAAAAGGGGGGGSISNIAAGTSSASGKTGAFPAGDGSSKVPPTDTQQQQRSVKEIFDYAAGQAFKGGLAGASAQVFNVFAFMWLRTTMNYQYRYGKSTLGAIKTLYAEGGIVRFYRGLLPALMQSPLSRFGDTAANVGVLAALDSKPATRDLPVGVKTAVASCGAAAWRFFLMPIDVRHHGFTKLYHGSVAAMGATWVGHYPWFFVHNYLSEKLPQFDGVPQGKHVRYGFIGFVSSVVSDTCSNSIRVLKTTKQTSVEPMSYPQALREVLAKDGVTGLLFRGLGTRILTNGLQGMVFSVGWKAIQGHLSK